jgi:flagellar biosynthesis/type III secretory pathway protein FliH
VARTLARETIVLDLGDLVRQGEQIKAAARAEADRVLAEAKAERQRLIATAADEGRAAGLAKGTDEGLKQGEAAGRQGALAEFREKLAALEQGWLTALGKFEAERDRMLLEARQDIVRLAALSAEMVTKRHAALNPGAVADQLGAVLALLSRPTRLTVAIHPDDQAIVREALPGLTDKYAAATHVEITPDPAIGRGGCVARTSGGGVIDATIETQLGRIVETLVPAAPAPTPPAVDPGAAA